VTLTLPKRDLMRYGADGCTVLLQMDPKWTLHRQGATPFS